MTELEQRPDDPAADLREARFGAAKAVLAPLVFLMASPETRTMAWLPKLALLALIFAGTTFSLKRLSQSHLDRRLPIGERTRSPFRRSSYTADGQKYLPASLVGFALILAWMIVF